MSTTQSDAEERSNQRISLISFAPGWEVASLRDVLSELGYAVSLIGLQNGRVAELARGEKPTMLFFGKGDAAAGLVEWVMQSLGEPPGLAVLDGEAAAWDLEILQRCIDLLSWPCGRSELAFRLRRAGVMDRPPSSEDEERLIAEFADLTLIGRSPMFVALLRLIKKIADCDVPLLIEGETGTGKEMVARAVHYLGGRRDHPFVPVNCGAIPENLFENELFGHERGAFTDARVRQVGLIDQAQHGTLFLDEIEELSPKGQVALLRFLQDGKYRPLGSERSRRAEVRVLAASNADLHAMVDQRRFREDLFFRLNVLYVGLPSLRDRRGDVEVLADFFIRKYCAKYRRPVPALHPGSLAWMRRYAWPGNVRELEHSIHRGILIGGDGPLLRLDDSVGNGKRGRMSGFDERWVSNLSFAQAKARLITQFEHSYLESLMADTGGNVTLAAKRAGKERRSLGKLLKKHGIDRSSYLPGAALDPGELSGGGQTMVAA